MIDDNFGSYVPSVKDNSARGSSGNAAPVIKSRRDVARQPSQDFAKSEYQYDQGILPPDTGRPPSRRNTTSLSAVK